MQKKQKSRKPYNGKIKRRKISNRSQQNRASKTGRTGGTENNFLAGELPKSQIPIFADFKEILPDISEDKPIIEILTDWDNTYIPNSGIMRTAIEVAAMHVGNDILAMKHEDKPFILHPNHNLTFKGLEKFVLRESEQKWSITTYYLDEEGIESAITTEGLSNVNITSREAAEYGAAQTIGELIYEDGKVNPANLIFERTVLIDKIPVALGSSKVINFVKDKFKQGDSVSLDDVNAVCRQFAKKLGGVISKETIGRLDEMDMGAFHFTAATLLVLGKNKWPFD